MWYLEIYLEKKTKKLQNIYYEHIKLKKKKKKQIRIEFYCSVLSRIQSDSICFRLVKKWNKAIYFNALFKMVIDYILWSIWNVTFVCCSLCVQFAKSGNELLISWSEFFDTKNSWYNYIGYNIMNKFRTNWQTILKMWIWNYLWWKEDKNQNQNKRS